MPLYEYLCDSCGRTMEVILQSFSDPHPTQCDRCGGTLKRLMSAPAVQFKGTGWYVSDYGKSGSAAGKAEKAEREGKAEKEGKSEKETKTEKSEGGSSESKPEPKAAETKSAPAPASSPSKEST